MKKRIACLFMIVIMLLTTISTAFAVDMDRDDFRIILKYDDYIGKRVEVSEITGDTYYSYEDVYRFYKSIRNVESQSVQYAQLLNLMDETTPWESEMFKLCWNASGTNKYQYRTLLPAMYLLLGNQLSDKTTELKKQFADKLSKEYSISEAFKLEEEYKFILAELNILEDLPHLGGIAQIGPTIKGLVTLLGYRSQAEQKGGYPNGYLSVAEDIGLTEGLGVFDLEDELIEKKYHQLVVNACSIPLMLSEQEITSGKRDYKRLLYASSEPAEPYSNLLSMHFDSYVVEGTLIETANGYQYEVNKFKTLNGKVLEERHTSIPVKFENQNFINAIGTKSEAILKYQKDRYELVSIVYNEDELAHSFNVVNQATNSPKGYANIKYADGTYELNTGDLFVFTAYTSQAVNQIAIAGDIPQNGMHTIPYVYLREHYGLIYEDLPGNLRKWTCKFCIFDPNAEGNLRTFELIANGYSTGITAKVDVLPHWESGSFSPTPQQDAVNVTVNGSTVAFDVFPQIINGRTMIPVRAVTEALGCDVTWDGDTQTVSITGRNVKNEGWKDCYIKIGSNMMKWEESGAWLNGGNSGEIILDSPAVIIDGRTLVPIRAIAELYGYNVDWDNNNRTVIITQ